MTNLSGAVAKTMNFVFSDIESSTNNEVKRRLESLIANIGKIATIPLDEIETSENVRKAIDTKSEGFLRLVESIKKYGILENVVAELKVNKKGTDYKLVCIAGHRRILAAKEAKNIERVPCLLQSYTHKGDSVGAALAENLNREDLHCLDIADGYRDLLASGWDEDELSKHFCRDIRTIKHYIKMSGWSDEVKSMFRENQTIFSTRVIMRQFAYRKFAHEDELKDAIRKLITPASAKKDKKSIKTSLKADGILDKKAIKQALTTYLGQQKFLSEIIKDEIKKAFSELKLI